MTESQSRESSASESANPQPGSAEWLGLVVEDVVEPERAIVDPHHHLWPEGGSLPYGLADLHADADDGHNIVRTVFIECHAAYDSAAPKHLQSLGETRFVTAEADRDPRQLIGGIVASADLRRDDLDGILDAHADIAGSRLKGIRHALASPDDPTSLRIPGRAPKGLAADADFRRGVARLGERGLTYDTWHYHFQQSEFLELARAVPGTTMILDHFGTPLGVGPYAAQRDEIRAQWTLDMTAIAQCQNVVAKLGGLAMPDNGYGWDSAERPPTSDEFVAAQRDWYLHTIEAFGPERCMFESNFPVDKFSLSYRTFWNGAKKIVADFSDAEKDAMFSGTASKTYRL